jgi:hypothetical protein
MKRSFLLIVLAGLLLPVTFYSCAEETKYTEEIAELDSLKTAIVDQEKQLETINFDSLEIIKLKVDDNIKTLKKIYSTDTIDASFARLLNTYKGINKFTKKYQAEHRRLVREFKTSKGKIDTLNMNLKVNALEDDLAKKYWNDEKLAAISNIESCKAFVQGSDFCLKSFAELNPKVEEVVNEYKNR